RGGGRRIDPSGEFYQTLRRWIAAGLPRTPSDAPKLKRVSIVPGERTLQQNETLGLRVTAHYSDGSSTDVTRLAVFSSSESAVVGVDPNGLVKAGRFAGEATIAARYEGMFANCDVSIPLPGEVSASRYDALPRANFIDDLV